MEKLKSKVISEEERGKELNTAGFESNKFVLKKIMKKYREVVSTVFSALIDSTKNTSGDNSLLEVKDNENNIQNVNLNKLNLHQLYDVMTKLGFVSAENSDPESQSLLKRQEKKLVCDLWDALKDPEGLVNVDNLFLVILSIINLYDYYLYSSYKKTTKNQQEETTTNNNLNKKTKKHDKKDVDEILAKISADIDSKIHHQTKYCGFDENDNLLISLEKAKMINQNFSVFYINFMNSNIVTKKKIRKPKKTKKVQSLWILHLTH